MDLDRREAEIRQRFVSQVASKEQELDKAKEDLELKYTRLRVRVLACARGPRPPRASHWPGDAPPRTLVPLPRRA